MKKYFNICKLIMVREREFSYEYDEPIKTSSTIFEIAKELDFDKFPEEHFGVFCIDARGIINDYFEIGHGDLCSCTTHPREVFKGAVKSNAGSVILVHNHPSGDPTPSDTDVETTQRLIGAGEILGIPVLDHIIVGNGRYVSMRASGHMEN